MKQKLKSLWIWFDLTSRPIGYLMTLLLVLAVVPIVLEKTFFTFTCETANFKCQYGWTSAATNAMSGLVGEVLNDNPNIDVQVVPKKR